MASDWGNCVQKRKKGGKLMKRQVRMSANWSNLVKNKRSFPFKQIDSLYRAKVGPNLEICQLER
jgi:hypothetical protein